MLVSPARYRRASTHMWVLALHVYHRYHTLHGFWQPLQSGNLAMWQSGNLVSASAACVLLLCFSDFGNHDNLAIWLSDVDSLCLFSCVAFGLRQRGTTIKCVQRLGLRGILFAQSSCVDGGHLDRSSTTRAPMQTYTSPRPPSNTRPIWQSGMQSDNPVPEPANRVGGEPTPNAAGRRNTHEDHQWLIYIYI